MLSWMHWTWKSGLGFGLLACMLIGLAILDHYRPGYSRKGLLPIATTRGDRVFMSVVSFAAIVLLWLKYLPETTRWWIFVIAGGVAFFLLKWG